MHPIALASAVEPWQGLVAVAALASVVAYLFKWADGRVTRADAATAAEERKSLEEAARRDKREAELKADYDAKLLAAAERYAEALRREHAENRAHEDGIRKEFVGVVATISDQTAKSAEALTDVLGRLHDRFTGGSSRRRSNGNDPT